MPPRVGGDICGRGIRQSHWPDRGVYIHERARGDQSRHRTGRRHAGQRSTSGDHGLGAAKDDRNGRIPGNSHRGGYEIHHQTQLFGHGCPGYSKDSQGGFHTSPDRPTWPGAY